MLSLMGPALIGATVYQFGIFLSTVFASVLEPGSVSWLFYADRLVQLPLGIFSIALASVLLPALSHARAKGDDATFERELVQALRSTSFVILPVSAGLYFFASPLTSAVFERGAFDGHSTAMTAEAIRAFAFGIWATSCHSMLMRAFIARKDTKTPVRIGIVSLVFVVLASLLLMGSPYAAGQALESSWALAPILAAQGVFAQFGMTLSLGHSGLAAASSLGSWIAFGAAALVLSRHLSLPWKSFVSGSALILAISLFAVGSAAYATSHLSPWAQLFGGTFGAIQHINLFSNLPKFNQCFFAFLYVFIPARLRSA
jgi:putative peptidoglycan lipid II flippase